MNNILTIPTGTKISQSTLINEIGVGYTVGGVAKTLRAHTGASYEAQLTSGYALGNATTVDIDAGYPLIYNPNAGLLGTGYPTARKTPHYVVGYGYRYNTFGSTGESYVSYLDPYKYISSAYGKHEISVTNMVKAVNDNTRYYIW